MKRRTLIKCLVVVAGGSVILPSCLPKEGKTSLLVKNFSLTSDQETMLAEFAETLIPASSTPGAKDTYSHLFVLRMVDDCYEKEDQQAFLKGVAAVEAMAQQHHQTSFTKATTAQKAQIVSLLETKKGTAEAQAFYHIMKKLTIQGYLTSKPVMGDIFHYELVPGRYLPAVPVKTIIHQA